MDEGIGTTNPYSDLTDEELVDQCMVMVSHTGFKRDSGWALNTPAVIWLLDELLERATHWVDLGGDPTNRRRAINKDTPWNPLQ